MSKRDIESFQQAVWAYYNAHGRTDLPWRQPEADGAFDPYKILVSELMLQQTQVSRVVPKYHEFLKRFPNLKALAKAPLADVLTAWQGLGYNRRAKFLWQASSQITEVFNGRFPTSADQLTTLPGVGKNTAGAIMNYAFNVPVPFVETNLRTVFIHHFLHGKEAIVDKEILELVEQTLPKDEPRVWFWALMDYGTFLKQSVGNTSRASKSYKKQSPLKGSRREIRGIVLRLLSSAPRTLPALETEIPDERLLSVLDDLGREELVVRTGERFELYR